MLGRAKALLQPAVGQLVAFGIHQSHGELDAQNAQYGVVDARHRHLAFVDQRFEVVEVFAVARWHHHHVHAGVDRNADGFLVVLGDLVNGVVVRNQEALETEFGLEDVREQPLAGRALDAVPTAVRGHDGAHARLDCRQVPRQVNPPQRGLIHPRIALVETGLGGAERGAAIAHVVLGAGQHTQRIVQPCALEAAHRRTGQFAYQLGVFGEALIGTAPADILRHGDAGAEGPLNSRGADLFGGDVVYLLDQLGIARAAQPDIVREDDRVEHVVVPVHGVDAVEDGDLEPRIPGARLQAV